MPKTAVQPKQKQTQQIQTVKATPVQLPEQPRTGFGFNMDFAVDSEHMHFAVNWRGFPKWLLLVVAGWFKK